MHTVWKFPLEITDEQDVTMPEGAEILCVQMQGETPCLWARLHAPSAEGSVPDCHRIRIVGTGHSIPDDALPLSYIGTVQSFGGSLIWHVFEQTRDRQAVTP